MDSIVKQSIDGRKMAFSSAYELTDVYKKKIDELFKKIEELGETCKDAMDFETKFMASPLNQEYTNFISNFDDYKEFCEANKFFNESGNYSGNAENVYRFISGYTDFVEQHMGLYDAQIEAEILKECISRGADFEKDYPLIRVLSRPSKTPYQIIVNGEIIHDSLFYNK